MPGKIIAPRSLVTAAQPLASPERMMGVYPYQWQKPGPHAKHVLANGQIPLPPANSSLNPVLVYQVPAGLRFSLRGVVFQFVGGGWIQGSGTLTFLLQVTDAGSRAVDFLNAFETQLGSVVDGPYPIMGPLEFAPESFLTVSVQNNAVTVSGMSDQFCIAHLVGHTYPNAEWDGGA